MVTPPLDISAALAVYVGFIIVLFEKVPVPLVVHVPVEVEPLTEPFKLNVAFVPHTI